MDSINISKLCELVKNSFIDYNIEIISCKRTINSKKPESKTNEVIIKSL